jgi:hypothetical protein
MSLLVADLVGDAPNQLDVDQRIEGVDGVSIMISDSRPAPSVFAIASRKLASSTPLAKPTELTP